MLSKKTILVLISLFTPLSFSDSDPKINWQQITRHDLNKIHHILQNESTLPHHPRSNSVKHWYTLGYQRSLALIPKVKNYSGYSYAIKYYINGFHISHLVINHGDNTYPNSHSIQWPGFKITYINKQFIVYSALKGAHLPPVGAHLINCDKHSATSLFKSNVMPFSNVNLKFKTFWASSANQLLIKDNNPFITYPHTCTFIIKKGKDRKKTTYPIIWRTTHLKFTPNKPIHPIASIKILPHQIAWVTLHGFMPNNITDKIQLKKIASTIKIFSRYHYIVFDIRNNFGGNSVYYRNIVKQLYGVRYLRSLGPRFILNQQFIQTWRASKNNIKALSTLASYQGQIDLNPIKKARQENKRWYTEKFNIIEPTTNISTIKPANPVSANILVLTNNRCWSSCWMFTRLLKQLPNVTQIGQTTAYMGQFGEQRQIKLYHDYLRIAFPMGVDTTQNLDYNDVFKPEIVYHGNINNTKKVKQWVEHTVTKTKKNTHNA